MSRADVLVSADWAEQNLGQPGIVFVEVDEDTSAYDKGHIAGAVKLDWKTELQDPVRRDFVDKDGFEKLLSAKGIGNDDTVDPLRRQQQLVRRLRLLVLQALRAPGRQAARRRPQEVGARLPAADRGGHPAPGHPVHRAGPGHLDPRVPGRGRRARSATRTSSTSARRTSSPGGCSRRRTCRRRRRSGPGTSRPRSTSRGRRRRTRTARSSPTTSCARSTPRPGSTARRRRSRTAGSASAPATPGSPCTSCSASRT